MSGGEILLIVGTAVSAIGSLAAGASAQRAANTNAQSLFNAAHGERLTAIENAKRQKRINMKVQGANRALDPDKLDLLEDTAMEQALVEMDIIHAGDVRAINLENRGRIQIAEGKAARSKAAFGAFSSILMGVGAGVSGGAFGGGSPGITGTVGGAGNAAGLPLNLQTMLPA